MGGNTYLTPLDSIKKLKLNLEKFSLRAKPQDFVELFSSLVYKVMKAYNLKQVPVFYVRCPVAKKPIPWLTDVFLLSGNFHSS